MDSASHHTVKNAASVTPISSSRKSDIQALLTERKIHWMAEMLKSELCHFIELHKPELQYIVDDMVLQHELIVVHLALYHCVLNPIALFWSWVKRHVAEKNTTFKIADVKRLMEGAFAAVPSDF